MSWINFPGFRGGPAAVVHGHVSFYFNTNVAQCGNFRIFLSLRFYVKSILENLEVLKLQFCHYWAPNFDVHDFFELFEGWNLPNQQNSELKKWQK